MRVMNEIVASPWCGLVATAVFAALGPLVGWPVAAILDRHERRHAAAENVNDHGNQSVTTQIGSGNYSNTQQWVDNRSYSTDVRVNNGGQPSDDIPWWVPAILAVAAGVAAAVLFVHLGAAPLVIAGGLAAGWGICATAVVVRDRQRPWHVTRAALVVVAGASLSIAGTRLRDSTYRTASLESARLHAGSGGIFTQWQHLSTDEHWWVGVGAAASIFGIAAAILLGWTAIRLAINSRVPTRGENALTRRLGVPSHVASRGLLAALLVVAISIALASGTTTPFLRAHLHPPTTSFTTSR